MRLQTTERASRNLDLESAPRAKGSLRVTPSGLRYINSPEYVEYMTRLVTLFYEPDGSFFGLLVGITAAFLSDTDPNAEDINAFDRFVSENITLIRSAISSIGETHPAIHSVEEMWEKNRAMELSHRADSHLSS